MTSNAPDHLFVSGAAVAVASRAIVLLGEPGPGLAALVDALVRDGASAYADGYVRIDAAGQVHPNRHGEPAGVAVIATLRNQESAQLTIHERSPDEGVLALLHHAEDAEHTPELALDIARAAVRHAAVLDGQWDRAEQASAALIERLSRVAFEPGAGPAELPPAVQFAALVLQLEGRLAGLAETLRSTGIDVVLLNGDQVRPALAHRLALSFSALLEVPRPQVPRALGALESAGWRPVPGAGGGRYFQDGVVVRVLPRPRVPLARARRRREPLAAGRLGFAEPESSLAAGEQRGPPVPVPMDAGGPDHTGAIAAALVRSADALTALDTLRLRTRERQFRGLGVQYGPGVHTFEPLIERLVEAALARLPSRDSEIRVVDVGTGTGVIALSIARERPDIEVLATDVSLRALGWARRNRRRLNVPNVRLARGSLLTPVPAAWRGTVSVIVSNPPMALPALAVELARVQDWPLGTGTGPGADGLGLVRALARDARAVLAPDGYLVMEMLRQQGPWIAGYFEELGYEAEIPSGEPGGYIVVAARWPGPRR